MTTPTHPVATIKSYVIGFVFSLILTVAAFMVIEKKFFVDHVSLYIAVAVLALLQLFVQAICFLKLNVASEDRQWNLVAFLFAMIVILIVVSGSLWIMYNLNVNMMVS